MRKGMFLLIAMTLLFSLGGPSEAKNPDISYWMRNISESALDSEPKDPDTQPQIIVSGATVHVMWIARNADWSGYKLFYRRSLDGGETWEAKQLLFEDADNLDDPTARKMAVDGNTVHIFQNHYRGPIEGGCLWWGVLTYFRSTDNGATFEAPRDLAGDASDWGCVRHIRNVYASATGGKVTVGYTDCLNWTTDHYAMVLTSDDNGISFSSHQALHMTSLSDILVLEDMQRVGDKIYALIRNSLSFGYGANDTDLYLVASSNAGASFTNNIISVPSETGDHHTGPLQDHHYVPKIAAVGPNVYVTFNGGDFEGAQSVFYRRSTDSGLTFGDAVNLTKTELPGMPIQAGEETIAAKGKYVYLVFLTTDAKVHFKRSTDFGASILARQELTATQGYYIKTGWWPVVQVDPIDTTGATVHVLWNQPTYTYSTNGGATFIKPVLLSTYFTYGARYTPQMAVGPDGAIHYVFVATITGGSDEDIFYRRHEAPPEPVAANSALKFAANGSEQRFDNMQVPAGPWVNFTTAMTVEGWIKPNRDPNTSGYFVYKAEPGAGGSWGSYMLGQWGSGQADARIATVDDGYVIVAGPVIPNGVWTHVAMTYNANAGTNNFKLFVNGALAGATTATGALKTGDGVLFVGADQSNHYYSDISVDELRLWKKALTQAQIVNYMAGPLLGTETGLAAYYNFNNTTKDITGHGNDGVLMYKETFVEGDAHPKAPSGLVAVAVASSQITLAWNDNATNEGVYKVERALGSCAAPGTWKEIAALSMNTTSYTNSGLTPATQYAFRVKDANSAGASGYSNCASATTGTANTPHAPTALKATSVSGSRINLSWLGDSAGILNFNVYRKKGSGVWSLLYTTSGPVQKTYADKTATGNNATVAYSYSVTACNASGCSPATTGAVVPFGPVTLGATPGAAGSGTIELNWTDKSSNETGFQVFRRQGKCTDVTPPMAQIAEAAAGAAAYSNTGLTAGQTYAYSVKAYKESSGEPTATGYSLGSNCSEAIAP